MAQKYFLILFICYLPVYLAVVFYLRTKIQGYSMRAHMVSYLAHSTEPWRSIFNVSTILYGGLSIVVPVSLHNLSGTDQPVGLGAAALMAAGTATVLVGFFPMDRRLKIHNMVGFFAFFSVLLTSFVFLSIFRQGRLYSPVMEGINYAVIATTLLLGVEPPVSQTGKLSFRVDRISLHHRLEFPDGPFALNPDALNEQIELPGESEDHPLISWQKVEIT